MQDVPKLTYGRLLNAMLFTIHWAKAGKYELKGQDLAGNTWQQQHAHVMYQLYKRAKTLINLPEVDSQCVFFAGAATFVF